MEYRSLGRTGVEVSVLCLGCMMFGGKTGPEESYAIIDRAIDAGINFLDMANVYSRGRSEEVTGEALKRNGKRHQIVLATKVHGTMDDNDPNMKGNSRRHIIQQCEAILRRRWTERIFDVVEGLQPIARDKGCALSQLALAWCTRQPGVTSPIIGPHTMEQLEDNLRALDVKITDDDKRRINEIIPPGQMIAPCYEADFGPHPYRW